MLSSRLCSSATQRPHSSSHLLSSIQPSICSFSQGISCVLGVTTHTCHLLEQHPQEVGIFLPGYFVNEDIETKRDLCMVTLALLERIIMNVHRLLGWQNDSPWMYYLCRLDMKPGFVVLSYITSTRTTGSRERGKQMINTMQEFCLNNQNWEPPSKMTGLTRSALTATLPNSFFFFFFWIVWCSLTVDYYRTGSVGGQGGREGGSCGLRDGTSSSTNPCETFRENVGL